MTKAREIIRGALSFHLNRLAPGEAEDADLFGRCLEALNAVADEFNGDKALLFREILSAGAVTGSTGTLGSTWPTLSPGDRILGATVAYSGGNDVPLSEITMQQYAELPVKATIGLPQFWAHDGLASVYFYPVPSGQSVTLRTMQAVSDFADLDTDYSMPKGYKSALQALVAEKMLHVNPSMAQTVVPAARTARSRLTAQAIDPGVINATGGVFSKPAGNILTGWR